MHWRRGCAAAPVPQALAVSATRQLARRTGDRIEHQADEDGDRAGPPWVRWAEPRYGPRRLNSPHLLPHRRRPLGQGARWQVYVQHASHVAIADQREITEFEQEARRTAATR